MPSSTRRTGISIAQSAKHANHLIIQCNLLTVLDRGKIIKHWALASIPSSFLSNFFDFFFTTVNSPLKQIWCSQFKSSTSISKNPFAHVLRILPGIDATRRFRTILWWQSSSALECWRKRTYVWFSRNLKQKKTKRKDCHHKKTKAEKTRANSVAAGFLRATPG